MARFLMIGVAASALLAGGVTNSAAEAPAASVAAPALSGGERWVYDQMNPYRRTREGTLTYTLAARAGGFELVGRSDRAEVPVRSESVTAPWQISAQSTGTARRSFDPGLTEIPFPLAAGQRWKEKVRVTDERGGTQRWSVSGRALRWERVKTPAGEFEALRVERQMNLGDGDAVWGSTSVHDIFWYVPEVKRWVRRELRHERRENAMQGRVEKDWTVWQLASYQLAK